LADKRDYYELLGVGRTADTNEITIAVEDIAQRGGPDFGYRLTVRKQAEDFRLSATPSFVNVPRGGTALISVNADRRGYDGPIHATIPELPKGWVVDGGYIAEETMDALFPYIIHIFRVAEGLSHSVD